MKFPIIALSATLVSFFALFALAQPAPGQMPTNEVIMERNDANKDGEITKAEAEAAQTQLGMTFDTFDLDKDGKVTAEELDTMRASMSSGGGQ